MTNEEKRQFERRKEPRVELTGVTGLPAQSDSARIVNISAGGAQVDFTSRLVPGNIYEMRLTFPDRQILARVRVTRSTDLQTSPDDVDTPWEGGCTAGLEFQSLGPEDRRYLEHYVAGLSGSRD